jgi:hypothetical protein
MHARLTDIFRCSLFSVDIDPQRVRDRMMEIAPEGWRFVVSVRMNGGNAEPRLTCITYPCDAAPQR